MLTYNPQICNPCPKNHTPLHFYFSTFKNCSAVNKEETSEIPKPILVVNGFCETPLDKRKEEVFPHQMLKYCQSRGHVLVTTVQLLCMYIDIKQHPERTKEIIEELLNCVSIYNKYTDYGEFIKH